MLKIKFEPNTYSVKMNVRKDKKEIGDRICDTFSDHSKKHLLLFTAICKVKQNNKLCNIVGSNQFVRDCQLQEIFRGVTSRNVIKIFCYFRILKVCMFLTY